MISGRDRIQKTSKHLATSVDNEVVILGIESGHYFGLNKIASEIWQRLDQPILVDDLILSLESLYSAKDRDIRHDVVSFLNTLQNKGLIEVCNENHA